MTSHDQTSSGAWGMWANTGDVDPVLARMLCMLRCHWASDPDAAPALAALGAFVAGTRDDDAQSRRRALLVVDRGIRRDLPRLLRAAPRATPSTRAAADQLEQLPPLEDARAAGRAIGLTFVLERRVDPVERWMIRLAWAAARHAELALCADRIYQLGSAAVYISEMFVQRRADLARLGHRGAEGNDLARDLAIAIVREAAGP